MKRHTPILVGLGSGIGILTLILWQFVTTLHQPMSLFHNDWYLLTFMLDHYMTVIQSGNWVNWSTYPMYYGFPNSIFFGEFFPLHIIIGYPLYVLTHNIFFVSNALVFLTILFSYASMFLLSFYVTKKVWPSVIAGIMYAVNPFVMARFPDHLLVLNGGFLPLIFLCIERVLVKPYRMSIGWVFIILVGQLLASTIYYSIFLTVLLPLYIVMRVLKQGFPEKQAIVNREALVGFILFLCVIGGMYRMYSKGNEHLYSIRSQESTGVYSAILSDWLFTAPNNMLYGRVKPWAAKEFPTLVREGIYSEHNLFTGIIPFILGLFGLWVVLSKKRDARISAIGCIGVLSLLLTFGPEVTIGDSIRFPGIYALIDAVHPLFGFLRVPARFGVFVFLSLSLCVAYGLSWVEQHIPKKKYIVLMICVFIGVLVEYKSTPWEFLQMDLVTKNAYESLTDRSDIQVIAEYPMGNSIDYTFPQARMEELDAHYLAYALLYHDKKLFNGYSGFIPRDYQKRADVLSVNFPTRSKLSQLKSWGVDAMVVHRDEFTQPGRYEEVVSSLISLGVPRLFASDQVAVFDLTVWNANP